MHTRVWVCVSEKEALVDLLSVLKQQTDRLTDFTNYNSLPLEDTLISLTHIGDHYQSTVIT